MPPLPRSGPARTTLLVVSASLLLAGLGLAASGCNDTLAAPGVGASAQTTEALAMLPTDADMIGMMDLAAARQSGAVDAVLGGTGLGMVSGDGSADFDEFIRMTGFDPTEDIDRVYIAATEGKGDGRAAFVAYGRFDRDRIERYIADQADADLEATEIDGLPVYFAAEEVGPRPGFALVNSQMVLAGDEVTLRAMIDRLGSSGSAVDAEMQDLLDRVVYPDGAWFAARGFQNRTASMPADAPEAALAARAARGVVVSMGFQADGVPVRSFVVTEAGANVDDVADAIRGGVSAAKMGLKDQPAVLDVLDRVEVNAEDEGVGVGAFLTTEFLTSVRQ